MKGRCPEYNKPIKLDDETGLIIYHEIRKRISKKTVDVSQCPGAHGRPK